MRTTLDIDDDVLQAAKELAEAEHKSAGRVVSDLVRKALTAPGETGASGDPDGLLLKDGFYVMTGREWLIITSELVERLLEEADLEEAGLKPK